MIKPELVVRESTRGGRPMSAADGVDHGRSSGDVGDQ